MYRTGMTSFCVSEQPFDHVPDAERESSEMDAPFRGNTHTMVILAFTFFSVETRLNVATVARKCLGLVTVQTVFSSGCALLIQFSILSNLGGVYNTTMPPVFQTGSGKAVLLGKDSIQKARVLLEGRKLNTRLLSI